MPRNPVRPAPVYLDHAATAPLRPSALAAVTEQLARGGNPSSLHRPGRAARTVVEQARDEVAAALGADPVEVVFTSGGTEADNLAVQGLYRHRRAADPRRRRILVSSVEHAAVAETVEWLAAHEGAEAVWLPVDADGRVAPETVRAELARDPGGVALLAVMWANNEVGAVQPVAELAALAAEFGVPLHCDAVQAFGSLPVDAHLPGLTTLAVSAHKLGGPVGAGALVAGRGVGLAPVQHGGGQERKVRSGTLDAAALAGFGVAAREAVAEREAEAVRLAALRDRLVEGVRRVVPGAVLRGPEDREHAGTRLPGNAHFTFPGCEGDSLLFLLDGAGIASSTGSACHAGVPRPSSVLLAMGLEETTARGAQRFSLGRTSTGADVDALLAALPEVHERALRAGLSGAAPH
ncbi:cysteine desulfurase family protein [Kocuria rosea]|uniref:cysteine desulfurase family protein n=1 Tax=Kocuria rosea TaxID=1275 RepID=UPI00203A731C|nr:cysteine desulfurase family protein [Kocuria rosea]MCM3686858.1 cysteine desulfurase [Kocuria rosea]